MRYRGRTIGFSLDDDSRLVSLQGSWSDSGGRFYELSFHHADVGRIDRLPFEVRTPLRRPEADMQRCHAALEPVSNRRP